MADDNSYILYVDDSEDDTIMAKRAFDKSHFTNEIVILSDGQECVDFLFHENEFKNNERGFPVVILLDLNMPRLSGFDVLKKLRENESTHLIPIVVLTTSDAESDILKSYELGANSYITKPLQTEEFFKTIQTLDMYWSVHNSKVKDEIV